MTEALPVAVGARGVQIDMPPVVSSLPISVQVLTDDATYQRCWSVAQAMAKSPGLVPGHLSGRPEACLSIILVSMEWKLNPYMVARSTYEPARGAKVGFEGKLIRAIAEASGRLEKPVGYEWYGPWENVQGKYEMRESSKTDESGRRRKYAAATYTTADEKGVGIKVILHMKGEAEPRTFNFDMAQAHPRNSTLWATDPKTQLMYTATRRAVDAIAPEILLGMGFGSDDMPPIGPDRAVDITPPAGTDPLFEPPERTERASLAARDVADLPQTTSAPEAPDSPQEKEAMAVVGYADRLLNHGNPNVSAAGDAPAGAPNSPQSLVTSQADGSDGQPPNSAAGASISIGSVEYSMRNPEQMASFTRDLQRCLADCEVTYDEYDKDYRAIVDKLAATTNKAFHLAKANAAVIKDNMADVLDDGPSEADCLRTG